MIDPFNARRLESLLTRPPTRQSRRQFQRLVQAHWPFEADPARFPRLAVFVERANALKAPPATVKP